MKDTALTIPFSSQGRRLLGLFICALFGAGCAAPLQGRVALPDSSATSPDMTKINTALAAAAVQTSTSSADYRVGPEDLLEITIFNIPEGGNVAAGASGPISRRTEVRVSQEGLITLPLLGDTRVAGLSATGLEQALRKRYDEFIHNPQIGVQVKEYRAQQVSVMGAVGKPSMYQLTGPRTLVDLLSLAGGINERAGSQVHLYRQSPQGRQSYIIDLVSLANNPGLVNMPVQAGDVINVPQAGMFFVDGAVGKPGAFPLTRSYTLTQALALAGGIDETLASYSDVTIFRHQSGSAPERVSIDLKRILASKADDPVIEAEDTIIVPISPGKYFVERFIGRIGLGGPKLF
jgi:polysaccharide export outer membrane protein